MSAIQTYTYKIRSYHTGASGKLFIHQVLNFLQDAAHNHADGTGFGQKQLAEQNLVWVLSRMVIEINFLPKRGDSLVLSTWVKSIRGSISEREFSIKRGQEVLIEASSLWFCLSAVTNKPVRLPADFKKLMAPHQVYATKEGTGKIVDASGSTELQIGKTFVARFSDIDIVDHVNNATYVRWVVDELWASDTTKMNIKKIMINYLGQCFLGDKVKVSHDHRSDSVLTHTVVNLKTNLRICRMQSEWYQ
jgi:acyl-ACP thioesterase